MSAASVFLRLQSLPGTDGTAGSSSTLKIARNFLEYFKCRPLWKKSLVQTRLTCIRHARVFAVSLLLLSPILNGSCATGLSASSSASWAYWLASFPAPLSSGSQGENVAARDWALVHLPAAKAEEDQPPSDLLSHHGVRHLDAQQDTAYKGAQLRVLAEKGKVRSPPLSHIHSALPEQAGESKFTTMNTETAKVGHTKSNSDRGELELKRLGAQARSKQTTTTKGTGHEASALPLRTYAYGNIHQTAYYFADVIIGTPAVQRQSLILDTGSSVVGFPCTSCKSCGAHIDPPFDCAASSTCKRLKCTTSCTHCDSKQRRCAYRVSYMEGSSLQGFWQEDYLRVLKPPRTIMKNNQRVYDIKSQMSHAQKSTQFRPTNTSIHSPLLGSPIITNFGCHMEETALFVNQKASGIWGLEIWSQFGPPTYMTRTLLSDNSSPHQLQDFSSSSRPGLSSSSAPLPSIGTAKVFALCLAEHGGAFAIGEAHNELHTSKLVKTRFIPDQESYSVYVSALVVGEQNIPLYTPKTSGASAKLPPAFISASFETLPPLATSSTSLHPSVDALFEVLLDSGTTMSYFPTDMYTSIITAIERHAEQQNEKLSFKPRRLGASITDTATAKAFVAKGRHKSKLLHLYTVEEKAESTGGDARRATSQNTTASAEERRLGGLRGDDRTSQMTEGDDLGGERHSGETIIVRNYNAKMLQLSGEKKTGVGTGVRRALPGEAEKSVQQRRSSRNQPPSEANVTESQEAADVTQALPSCENNTDCLDNREDADGHQQVLETEAQSVAYTPKPQTSMLFVPSPSGEKRTAAKSAYEDGGQPSDTTRIRIEPNAKERRTTTSKTAGPFSADPALSRIQIRSGRNAFVPLGSNIHLAFSGRRTRLSNIWEKLQLHRKARFIPFGEEVRDSEAKVIGDILSSHRVDDEKAYELLPQSASPRQSQAVKVESAEGELCFYLPKGRADLKYFPDIWIKFAQTSPYTHTSDPSTTGRGRDGAAATARTSGADSREGESVMREASRGWLRWKPSSYLYTKGNDHYRCIALSDDPKSKTTGVLGSSFFIGHDVIFDVGNHTVAFAEAGCPWIRLKDRPRDLPL